MTVNCVYSIAIPGQSERLVSDEEMKLMGLAMPAVQVR
jgi:hypothetical protein